MRLIHTCSGLLSIIGAAFLFATVHALLVKPVSVDPPVLTGADAPVSGDPSRARRPIAPSMTNPEQSESQDPGTQAPTEDTLPPLRSISTEQVDLSEPHTSPLDAILDAPVPEGMLTLRQSHSLWEQGAYFIDARHEEEYIEGHIQYAAWLSASLFNTDSDRAYAVVESMPPDATVVIYCVGGECDASKNVASRLQQIGFSDLRVMGVGYEDWVIAGFPTEEGQP